MFQTPKLTKRPSIDRRNEDPRRTSAIYVAASTRARAPSQVPEHGARSAAGPRTRGVRARSTSAEPAQMLRSGPRSGRGGLRVRPGRGRRRQPACPRSRRDDGGRELGSDHPGVAPDARCLRAARYARSHKVFVELGGKAGRAGEVPGVDQHVGGERAEHRARGALPAAGKVGRPIEHAAGAERAEQRCRGRVPAEPRDRRAGVARARRAAVGAGSRGTR